MGRLLLVALICLGGSGCSFTLGSFDECHKEKACPAGFVCQEGYCLADLAPAGCGTKHGDADGGNAILFGVALPLTSGGVVDQSEQAGLNAVLLALEEVNQRDGVGGRKFALEVCDTEGSTDKVKEQVQYLIEDRKTAAVLTSGSAQTLSAAEVATRLGGLVMTATATSAELTALSDSNLVWRTAPSDAIQGRVMAELLLSDPVFTGVNDVVVLYVDDPYGQGLQSLIQERYGQGKDAGQSISAVPYPRSGNIDSAISQLAGLAPDLTVLVGFADDANRILLRAATTAPLRRADGHRWLFSDAAKDPALFAGAALNEAEGRFGTAPAQGAGLAFDGFAQRFRAKFQTEASSFSFTSHSYDAFYALALGAAHAVGTDGSGEVTGAKIASGLAKLSADGGTSFRLAPDQFTQAKTALQGGGSIDVEGASGKLQFNAAGEAPSPIELWQVDGGTFVSHGNREPGP